VTTCEKRYSQERVSWRNALCAQSSTVPSALFPGLFQPFKLLNGEHDVRVFLFHSRILFTTREMTLAREIFRTFFNKIFRFSRRRESRRKKFYSTFSIYFCIIESSFRLYYELTSLHLNAFRVLHLTSQYPRKKICQSSRYSQNFEADEFNEHIIFIN